jgi:hypothetical protein
MSNELKACPLCNCRADYDPEYHDPAFQRVYCKNDRCMMHDMRFGPYEWNTRPIEDRLHGLLKDWVTFWEACTTTGTKDEICPLNRTKEALK